MNMAERTRLRKLQDRWLALPSVQHQIREYGDDQQIACSAYATDVPTFRDVRTLLLPTWEGWFKDFFRCT